MTIHTDAVDVSKEMRICTARYFITAHPAKMRTTQTSHVVAAFFLGTALDAAWAPFKFKLPSLSDQIKSACGVSAHVLSLLAADAAMEKLMAACAIYLRAHLARDLHTQQQQQQLTTTSTTTITTTTTTATATTTTTTTTTRSCRHVYTNMHLPRAECRHCQSRR